MRDTILTKQFLSGALFTAVGAFAVVAAHDYPVGTANRLGPGAFPTGLGLLLVAIGIGCMVRGAAAGGEIVSPIAWRPLLLIFAAILSFAVLLPLLGLPLALLFLIAVSSAGSKSVSFDFKLLLAMVLVVAACVGLFVYGLGLPLPLIGSIFTGDLQ